MIKELVASWEENKHKIENSLRLNHPDNYKELVKLVITHITQDDYIINLDPERITEINHGGYQGTLVFVIADIGYQPSDYWYIRVSYGSCSGCDTLERIRSYDHNPPTDEQVKDYMTLALHIVQQIKKMDGESV